MISQNHSEVVGFLKNSLFILREVSTNYAADWVKLKIEFYNKYHNGLVFSNRVSDFEDIFNQVIHREPLKAIPDERGRAELSDWDKNFNDWLSKLR